MGIELSRKSGVPLYIQLKDQIRQQIESGVWGPGFRLPAERELAALLGVSRNTVSMAYRELELEGELVSQQGRGTFVSETAAEQLDVSRRQRLRQIIDAALDQSSALGVGLDEFLEAVNDQAQERKDLLSKIRIAFIECNREQVDYFARQLEFGSGVSIISLVLDDAGEDLEHLRQTVSTVDLVVTTFFHFEQVRALVPADVRVVAIALDPELETIVRIARIPHGKRMGLVCLSRNFADTVVNSIRSVGIDYLPIEITTSLDEVAVRGVIQRSDVILVSPGRRRQVEQWCPPGKDIIEFIYRPDQGSISMLKSVLLDLETKYIEEGESDLEFR
ncbi:MAG: GntR family transcriptional regulator [Bacillota bacterium]|jgi:DNA-binding transcriptional regulator YhcF (GntR family)